MAAARQGICTALGRQAQPGVSGDLDSLACLAAA
eukprot:CAMPEP_0180035508 /NCGR_PEP_ID=MMETSP0984-20121128/30313_1 /TAXON_ID=483367 /ORGANISM="non described non described, Strain CCMP 2436" /LENGTH=33 /DNA_ID= /DNA_START= /DNA_END= /DNA_ORIENTATION=